MTAATKKTAPAPEPEAPESPVPEPEASSNRSAA